LSALFLALPFVLGLRFSGSTALASASGVGNIPQKTQPDSAYADSYGFYSYTKPELMLETLERLRALPHELWIRGNGERWLLEPPVDRR